MSLPGDTEMTPKWKRRTNCLLQLEGGPKGPKDDKSPNFRLPKEKKNLACLNLTLIQQNCVVSDMYFSPFSFIFLRAFFHYIAHSSIPKHFPNSQLLQTLTQQIIWTLAILKYACCHS